MLHAKTMPNPCAVHWEDMKSVRGGDRLCAKFETIVHDISVLTEEQAKDFRAQTKGRLCIRYMYDPSSGKIAFREADAASD